MTKLFNYSIIAFYILVLSSCSPQLNYMGNSYAPTQNIDIFFDEADIKKDFKVMGIVKNEGAELELDDPESVQKAMLIKARSVGADGILFLGLYHEVLRSQRSTTTYNSYGKNKVSNTESKKIYEAKFIKYN